MISSHRRLVVHVTNSLGVNGGAEQQLVANLRRFADPRLEHRVVCLYTRDYGSRLHEIPSSAPVHFLFGDNEQPRGRLDVVRRLHHLLAELHPDLIHCSVAEASLASRVVGAYQRIPVVESLINISHEPVRLIDNPAVRPWKLAAHRLVDRVSMRRVARFHALTPAVATSWQREVGLPERKITVVPRGVDFPGLEEQAQEGNPRLELGLPPEAFVILNVGRLVAQKGQRYLVAAMPHILRSVPAAVLLIAGQPGSQSEFLLRLVSELRLEARIRILGARDDVPALLRAADVFVFPSLYEGLGVSLLEAMASGRACVTTNRPPMNEIISDGDNGLLVPPMDAQAIARAVVGLAADPSLRQRLGCNARQQVVESFDVEATAAAVERIYLDVLGLA